MKQISKRIAKQPAFRGVPWRQGNDCFIGDQAPATVGKLSKEIRSELSRAYVFARDAADADERYQRMWNWLKKETWLWQQPAALRLLHQILQTEDFVFRRLVIDILAQLDGKPATEVLAKLAVFDLDDSIRSAATDVLLNRTHPEALPILLSGLRHVWRPAADHSADALVSLCRTDALPALVRLLDAPDPGLPFEAIEHGQQPVVRELVRLNHNLGCVVCHATASEGVPNVVFATPAPERRLSEFPNTPPYYGSEQFGDLLVRIDFTYLRQDFSVKMPCDANGAWPKQQRFDFFTRIRSATQDEIDAASKKRNSYPQRDAVLCAVRGLTGQDGGESKEEWERIVQAVMRECATNDSRHAEFMNDRVLNSSLELSEGGS